MQMNLAGDYRYMGVKGLECFSFTECLEVISCCVQRPNDAIVLFTHC